MKQSLGQALGVFLENEIGTTLVSFSEDRKDTMQLEQRSGHPVFELASFTEDVRVDTLSTMIPVTGCISSFSGCLCGRMCS